jgi:hypothetical protein
VAEERDRWGATFVIELYVFCEGPTEQNFCNRVLQPTLFPNHTGIVRTIQIANSRKGGVTYRGGIRSYPPVKTDITNQINGNSRPNVFFTSMIDLYALPNDFPGRQDTELNPLYPHVYIQALEEAFGNDINDARFVPYLQLYEYETLLFSHIESFRYSFEDCDAQIGQLQQIIDSVQSIEHINDGAQTAPSKRLIQVFPEYAGLKTTAGVDIAEYTGIDVLREQCPHFNRWIERLLQLWAEEVQGG